MQGSYQHLDGGWAMWGWRVLTGDSVFRLKLNATGAWERVDFVAKKGKDGIDGGFYGTKVSQLILPGPALILSVHDGGGFYSEYGTKERYSSALT